MAKDESPKMFKMDGYLVSATLPVVLTLPCGSLALAADPCLARSLKQVRRALIKCR